MGSALGKPRLSPGVESALLDSFVDACEAATGDGKGLGFLIGRWVVRDEDLELFQIVRDAIITLASAEFFLKNVQAATLASLALGAVSLLRNTLRSAGILKVDEMTVLVILRTAQSPLSSIEILRLIQSTRADWDEARVGAALNGLSAIVTLRDVFPIVKQDANGRWVVIGI